jgi:hypothetical protein
MGGTSFLGGKWWIKPDNREENKGNKEEERKGIA